MSQCKLPENYTEALREIFRLREKLRILREKAVVPDFLLGLGSWIEHLEYQYTPRFLMNVEMSHSEKWSLILQREDNPDILIFLKRMDKCKLQPEVLCRNMDLFHATLKSYQGFLISEVEEEKDWISIFKTLKIENVDQQNSIKVLTKGFTREEYNDAWEIIENREPRSDDKACIYVSGIPYDTRHQIEESIKIDGFVADMERITILKDQSDQTKFKGEAIIIFKTCDTAVKFFEKLNEKDFGENSLHIRLEPWIH